MYKEMGIPGSPPVNTAQVPNTATASGYSLSVFATAPSAKAKPDSIVQYKNTVFIGYQMAGDVKDGSVPGLTNTVVQYDLNGNVLKSYAVPGHVDGLMTRHVRTRTRCGPCRMKTAWRRLRRHAAHQRHGVRQRFRPDHTRLGAHSCLADAESELRHARRCPGAPAMHKPLTSRRRSAAPRIPRSTSRSRLASATRTLKPSTHPATWCSIARRTESWCLSIIRARARQSACRR